MEEQQITQPQIPGQPPAQPPAEPQATVTPTPPKKFPWKKLVLVLIALIVVAGGVGTALAWKTTYLDNYLPTSMKEFFGRGGEPTPPKEPTPFVISSVKATKITETRATITWTTDVEATSQVEYGETSSYDAFPPEDSTLVTSHAVSLSGLSEGTLYHYRVKSKDASGNLAVSEDYTFTTLDRTRDWETHTDSILGFKIKYPPGWSVELGTGSDLPGYDYDNVLFWPSGPHGDILFSVSLWEPDKPAGQSLTDYVEERMDVKLGEGWGEQFLPVGPTVKWEEVEYGGLGWYELVDMYQKKWLFTDFPAQSGNKVYNIQYSLSLDQTQVELMLSTVIFLGYLE